MRRGNEYHHPRVCVEGLRSPALKGKWRKERQPVKKTGREGRWERRRRAWRGGISESREEPLQVVGSAVLVCREI